MTNRRIFIKQIGLASAGAFLVPSLAFSATRKSIGIQLYTLRDLLPKDVKGTIQKIGLAGYNEVEVFGYSPKDHFWGFSAKEFKKILSDNGLKSTSGHYSIGSFLSNGNTDELNASIEAAKTLGSNYLTIPWLDQPIRKSADDYKKIAEGMNRAAEICKKSGLKLAYHNHDFEFKMMGGLAGYEILLKETDASLVDFEMDLYWVVRSGNDPLSLFSKYPGRFSLWHVKDMDKANKNLNTEIGKGSINFKAIFEKAKLAGMKHFFVEQETNYVPDPVSSIKSSLDYIRKELI